MDRISYPFGDFMTRYLFSGVSLVTLLVAGCTSKPSGPANPKARFSGVTLKVLIPDSELLRDCIDDQRGEWAAQTGAVVELEPVLIADLVSPQGSIPGSALAAQTVIAGDVLIFPATEMANVVAADQAMKVPREVLDAPDYERADIGRAVLDQLVAWDRQSYGMPISAECMLVYYRLDLFSDPARRQLFQEKYARALEPPKTWDEFDQLAEFFDGQDLNGDSVPDRSIALSSPGDALICRAAALGKAPQNFSFFFDVNSFEPMVTRPAFLEAMKQWQSVLRFVATPAEDRALAKFTAGQAALALGSSRLAAQWLRSETTADSANRIAGHVACSTLPASTRVYQHDKQAWADLPADKPNRAAIVNGLVGSVPKNSRHPDAAYDFLTFLTSRARGLPYVTTPAFGLGPYRMSHLVAATPWAQSGWTLSGTAPFLAALSQSLNEANAVAQLRIDASDLYHQSLNEAASEAFRGDKAGLESLNELAARWKEISEERGHDRQRRSYRYSLGMPVLN
jgi:multiple sugar transport system substrate-binding protein